MLTEAVCSTALAAAAAAVAAQLALLAAADKARLCINPAAKGLGQQHTCTGMECQDQDARTRISMTVRSGVVRWKS